MIGYLKNNKFSLSKSVEKQFLIFSAILIFTIIYSFFTPIPAQEGSYIGISSPLLNIGDRDFYINNGYGNIRGSFLYPLILKVVSKFLLIFNLDNMSKTWNLIVISISSLLSLSSLLLIDRTAFRIFGHKVAFISNWLFITCPYTLFYSINGSITMYIVFGLSLVSYIVSKSTLFNIKNKDGLTIFNTSILLFLPLVFLSSLRPTGAIFSICLSSFLIFKFYLIQKKSDFFNKDFENRLIFFIYSLVFIYASFQIYLTQDYLQLTLNNFINEKGTFFGVQRDLIREELKYEDYSIFDFIKRSFYWIIWRSTEFIAGLSDIRDSHRGINQVPLLPFFLRTFTGIFIIFPINLFAFMGLLINFKRIYNSGILFIFISVLISISPSLLGVAFTRYIYMFYPPIIIISGSCLAKLITLEEQK